MEDITLFINMLERAGIKHNVEQSKDEDGGSLTLEVYVYDNNSVAVFEFDAENSVYDPVAKPHLKGFRIV